MPTGRTIEAIGKNFPEGLMVAIAKELDPNPNMPQIIGKWALETIARVTGQPLELSGRIAILISAGYSDDPDRCQSGLNPISGEVTIQLPERGRSAVKKLNPSFLQIAAAGALSIELARRSTNLVTDDDFRAFAAAGVKTCGDILAEINEKVRRETGEGETLNLLEETPEITGYDFLTALGLNPHRPEEKS